MGGVNRPRGMSSRLDLIEQLLSAIEGNASAIQRLVSQTRAETAAMLNGDEGSSRSDEIERLRHEAEQLREALASLVTIERAKGILMQQQGISDTEAWALLEAESRRRNRTVRDVAANLAHAVPRRDREAAAPPVGAPVQIGPEGRADP